MRSKLLIGGLGAAVAFLLATSPVVAQAAGFITSADIVNNTIKSKDVKDNGLKGKDVKDNGLTGKDIEEHTLGIVPDAAHLNGQPGSSYQDKASILFGTIEPAGAGPLLNKARGVVAVERVAAGYFNVQFNRDVSGCTWAANFGNSGSGVGARFATTRDASAGRTADPSWMAVVVFDADGNQVDSEGFSVTALCP